MSSLGVAEQQMGRGYSFCIPYFLLLWAAVKTIHFIANLASSWNMVMKMIMMITASRPWLLGPFLLCTLTNHLQCKKVYNVLTMDYYEPHDLQRYWKTAPILCVLFFFIKKMSLNSLNLSVLYSVATNLRHQKNYPDDGLPCGTVLNRVLGLVWYNYSQFLYSVGFYPYHKISFSS